MAVTERIAPLLLALYLGSTLWLAFAQYGPLFGTVPVLAVMAALAIAALLQVSRAVPSPDWLTWAVLIAPVALYAGWTSCAIFVNFAEVAPTYGFDRFGMGRTGFGLLSLAAATVLAIAVLWAARGQPAYAATVVWALTGIIAATISRDEPRVIGAAAALAIAAVAGATWWLRRGPIAQPLG